VTAVKKISVSRAVLLLQCSRQGWMTIRNDFDWLTTPIAEAQALGTVSHKFSEEVDSGAFDHISDRELSDSVLNRWNELVAAAFEEMKTQSAFGAPAVPKRWPYYVIKQAAALDRANFRRQMRGEGQGARRPQLEVFLESDELGLVGRADKIEYLGDDVRIVDLKTAENPGGEIPLAYQYQLVLYAAMWHEMYGKLPSSVAIEWQDGSRSYRQIDPKEVDEVVTQLRIARADLTSTSIPSGAASEDTCRYCSYRALCPDFQNVDRSSWVRQSPFIVGQIEDIIDSHQDRSLVVRILSSQPSQMEKAVIHKFPTTQMVSNGDFVVFDRLSWRGGAGNFDVVWSSRYRNFGAEIPSTLGN